jgi:hypothetical protein
MADKYADVAIEAGDVARAGQATGVVAVRRRVTFETAAAFAVGEIRRLFKVGAHEIPVEINIVNDAIAGATDVEIGLWRPSRGVVIDQDCLMGTLDIAAGFAWAAKKDGLAALDLAVRGISSFREIVVAAQVVLAVDAADQDAIGHIPDDSYDVGMIFNSDVSAVGTITVELITVSQQ